MSRLESLADEIVIELLEDYLDGVDVLVAFGNHLNGRFIALVDQCRLRHFDFRSVRKDDFELCLRYLPNCYDRIRSLTLSEDDTPYQIHAFLSIFPTFARFQRLRQLHLTIDGNTVELQSLIQAMRSLFRTKLHTLSIAGKHMSHQFYSSHIIPSLLTMPSLERLTLAINLTTNHYNPFRSVPSNIQYLTIAGNDCTWYMLKAIFKCVRRLYYLNVRVSHLPSDSYDPSTDRPLDIQPLTKLQTFILSFIGNYNQITLSVLVSYIHKMSRLRHLQIFDSSARFLDGTVWQRCIQTGLLFLNCFILMVNSTSLREYDFTHLLPSFRTPFWIERENFNVYVIPPDAFNSDAVDFSSGHNRMDPFKYRKRLSSLLTMVPQRCENDRSVLVKNLTTLCVSSRSHLLSTQYYFSDIKRLTLNDLGPFVFRWITRRINLLHLTELRVPLLEMMTVELHSLLILTKNLTSLMIHFSPVFSGYSASIHVHDSVKRLDISLTEHPFRPEGILLISERFPSLEHLKINPTTLANVPLLNTYLPKLRSLTFKIVHPRCSQFIQQWNRRLRSQTQLPLNEANKWVTLWIDRATFETRYWSSPPQREHQLNHERLSKSPERKCVCS